MSDDLLTPEAIDILRRLDLSGRYKGQFLAFGSKEMAVSYSAALQHLKTRGLVTVLFFRVEQSAPYTMNIDAKLTPEGVAVMNLIGCLPTEPLS